MGSTFKLNFEKAIKTATRRAINKLATKAQTTGSRAVRETYNIKAKDLRKYVRLRRANYSNLQATLTVSGKKIPVKYFAARQTRRGVTVRIRKDRGRRLIRTAFLATMRSGHTGVYRRKRKQRLPIKELFTVAPPKMFERAAIKEIQNLVEQESAKLFDQELNYELQKGFKL